MAEKTETKETETKEPKPADAALYRVRDGFSFQQLVKNPKGWFYKDYAEGESIELPPAEGDAHHALERVAPE